MQAIWRRIPDEETFERNKPKIFGFTLGVVAPIVGVLFFHAVRTGEGLYEPPVPADREIVYPNL